MSSKQQKQLEAARALVRDVAAKLDLNAWVRLWDGSRLPLGKAPTGNLEIAIASPAVIGTILRKPTLDTIIQQYVEKGLDFSGGTLVDLGREINKRDKALKVRGLDALKIGRRLTPFLFEKGDATAGDQGFAGDITGTKQRSGSENKDYIQFHYDLSNDFYALFLDPEMVYSCAYYTDWANGVEQAQADKLDMICRKLRLKAGEKFLDIGSGWGGLVCHAAKNYGVTAHGITLSQEQLDFARAKVKRLGLEDKITLELRDYQSMTGSLDKIASIGMYEHIGLKNIPGYMDKVRSLLNDDGLFLNHAIARRAPKPKAWLKGRMRPEKKAIAKYIFPGGELDDIGHSIVAMERAGFEVHDVEGWRLHYARTCQLWCERLTANREQAIAFVGEEKYRIWVAYLAGVSLAFSRGTLRLFQTLASKSAKRPPALPPTRADLYR
jgi:cyclopropane-fatty-acyl-phospholipid synthase